MSELPASLPDPPLPGSVVWRGWLTKKGSFVPTLKRRFGTLHIGPDYAPTFDYRKDPASPAVKGSRIFAAATKCLQSGAIGSFPQPQCLVVAVEPGEDGAKLYCCFDSAEERDSFKAAVEWAVNARSHVAAFRSKQEEAKKQREAEENEMQRVQAQWHSTHQMLEDELSRMQHLASEQTVAQQTAKMQRLRLEDREFVVRLARESDEHKKSLQQAAIRAQIPVDARSHRLQSNHLQHDDSGLPLVFSLDKRSVEEFVQTIAREQEAHVAQLAAAAEIAAQFRSETITRATAAARN
jgi:hypothetical protein